MYFLTIIIKASSVEILLLRFFEFLLFQTKQQIFEIHTYLRLVIIHLDYYISEETCSSADVLIRVDSGFEEG